MPMAWLVRVKDTPEHRQWLRRIAGDLIALQDSSGAIREIIRIGDGPYKDCIPKSNAEYGSRETSLIQVDGDGIADMLYTCNFAFIGLHEASAATGDPLYAEAEEKLAKFLCRIQVRSEAHPELDGAWYRAFDFRRWEYWASNADSEWGPWCTESGWTQPWIAGTLALRQRKTSLWDLLKRCEVREPFERLRPQMLPDDALTTKMREAWHEAQGKAVALATGFSAQYAGGGAEGLTDGELAGLDYLDPGWQGYHGVDLVATIDLGEPRPIRQVSARFLQQVSVGIFLPASVVVAVSRDGREFEELASLKPDVPANEPGPLVKTLTAEGQGRPARFVRIQAKNLGAIPAWHSEAPGARAWLFCDEIFINPESRSPIKP